MKGTPCKMDKHNYVGKFVEQIMYRLVYIQKWDSFLRDDIYNIASHEHCLISIRKADKSVRIMIFDVAYLTRAIYPLRIFVEISATEHRH